MLKSFHHIGKYILLLSRVFKKPDNYKLYGRQTVNEMVGLGLGSLGLISIIKGNYNNAEASLKQAIALDPDYTLAYENLVLLSQERENPDEIKLYLLKILEIIPDHNARQILKNI